MKISVCRIAIGCLVLTLLHSSNVSAARVFAPADANADHTIDVRDVQLVGTALLENSSPGDAADVNGDGRVDVLDFQQVVNEAAKASSSSSNPATPCPAPCNTPAPTPAHKLLALKTVASATVTLPSYALTARLGHSYAPLAPRHARLQRLGLAAHAPPAA